MSNTTNIVKKPIQLRVVFILNALMMILPFVFYYIFTSRDITIGDLDPMWMVYTGIAYILSFIVLVFSILKQKIMLFRAVIVLNFLIALPAGAYIGMVISVISMILSFNQKIKTFFSTEGKIGL